MDAGELSGAFKLFERASRKDAAELEPQSAAILAANFIGTGAARLILSLETLAGC